MTEIKNQITYINNAVAATHEARHAVVAAAAGFEVVSVSIRPKGRWSGGCQIFDLQSKFLPWDLDDLIQRHETTRLRCVISEDLEFCIGALMAANGWTRSELIRLVRAQICVCLAGDASFGCGCDYEPEQFYPDGHDFDITQSCLKLLDYLGDTTTADDLSNDFVFEAIDSFNDSIDRIADLLMAKKYVGRRELARLLPKPWVNWPRYAAPAMAA